MGWDAEQAEDQYWEYRAHGLTDAEIIHGMTPHGKRWTESIMGKSVAARLRAQIEEAQALLAKIENRPEEPEQDLVIFEVQFNGYGRVYSYAGIRADGKWYVTGQSALAKVEWHDVFDHFERRKGKVIKVEACVRISDVRDFI